MEAAESTSVVPFVPRSFCLVHRATCLLCQRRVLERSREIARKPSGAECQGSAAKMNIKEPTHSENKKVVSQLSVFFVNCAMGLSKGVQGRSINTYTLSDIFLKPYLSFLA